MYYIFSTLSLSLTLISSKISHIILIRSLVNFTSLLWTSSSSIFNDFIDNNLLNWRVLEEVFIYCYII